MRIVAPDDSGLSEAVAALRAGEVVMHPTETVYGLAVDPTRPDALERLFDVKGREEKNPVLVIVGDRSQLGAVAREIPVSAEVLMDCFWPGPLSLLLPRNKALPERLTSGLDDICVRWTAHPVAQALCRAFGGPLTSTSANRSGEPPATAVSGAGLPGIAVAIDGGTLKPSAPSTAYNPVTGQLVRQGAVAESLIKKVLGI
jgi:L-threonylcarbamoyladenylate synthase